MPGLALRLGANSTFCFVISLSSAIKPVKMRLWKSRKFLKPGCGGIGSFKSREAQLDRTLLAGTGT